MSLCDKNILDQARKGNLDILTHPSVDKIVHQRGWTPLHLIAGAGCVQALDHPSVNKVVDPYGNTPLHDLAKVGKVPREWIVEKYSWFKLGRRKITMELITEILNTSNAERFIMDL